MSPRVLHYVDSSRPGGIETHLVQLLPALRRAGIGAELLLHRRYGPHPMVEALAAAGVPVRHLGGRARALPGLLRARPGTVLHTHGYKAGLLGRLAARLAGVPAVSTMHSGASGGGRVGLWTALDRATAGLGTEVVVSPAQCARHPRAVLVPNGIALPAAMAPPGRRVAFVGRMAEEKGPLAFARLARALPAQDFVAFGDGPLLEAARAEAGGRVAFRGGVPDMAEHWPGIGLLVMPSVFEGLPMAALEAMARGIPVAAYAVGGLPGLLADCGFLAPPGDEAALARAVADWAEEAPQARALRRQRCRDRVTERHDIAMTAAALAALYDRVTGAAADAAPAPHAA